jgi:hypothetical protein
MTPMKSSEAAATICAADRFHVQLPTGTCRSTWLDDSPGAK